MPFVIDSLRGPNGYDTSELTQLEINGSSSSSSKFYQLYLSEIVSIISLCHFIFMISFLIKITLFSVDYYHNKNANKSITTTLNKYNNFWKFFFIDFAACVVPILIFLNFFTQHLMMSYLIVFLVALIFICYLNINKKIIVDNINDNTIKDITFSHINNRIIKSSVYMVRSTLYILTSIAILGVDFNIFPRYLAKKKNFGISYMDVGVGYFIFCHSLRIIRNSNENYNQMRSNESLLIGFKHFPKKFLKEIYKNRLIFILGVSRLVITKLLHYKISTAEYGVHWNFFFTIYFVKVGTKLKKELQLKDNSNN
jgi:hypothetical protein